MLLHVRLQYLRADEKNKSGTAASCGATAKRVFDKVIHIKFNENLLINEDFKSLGSGGMKEMVFNKGDGV